MATRGENEKAVASILPTYLLDEFIDWIASNMEPDDVFDADQLKIWANNNGFKQIDD